LWKEANKVMRPNRLGAFTVAAIVAASLGGWQFVKYFGGYGLFYSISPRYGWIILSLLVGGMFALIYRGALRDKDF